MTQSITIKYFAALREHTNKEEEVLLTEAKTLDALYETLNTQYRFPLKKQELKGVLNESFCTWETPIQEGDVVAFIPPVSGG